MRSVSFAHSDIEGRKALLITVADGVSGPDGIGAVHSIKLLADELAEAAEIATSDQSSNVCPPDCINIRECIGHFIGRTIEDITQHDRDEFEESRRTHIQFLLSGGDYIKFFIGPDGFQYSADED